MYLIERLLSALIIVLSLVFFFNITIFYQGDSHFWWLLFAIVLLYFYVKNIKISLSSFDLKRNDFLRFINKKSIAILIIIVILAALIRLWGLGLLSPARDEFSHLVAAKRWLDEGFFNYDRGWEISYMVGFLFKIFQNQSVYIARLVPVFWGVLTTIPIYLLGKEFNRRVGLIAAFLWAVSPFAIGISRYTREYIFYLFLTTLGLWLFYYLRSNLKKKRISKNRKLIVGLLLIFLLAYPLIPEVSLTYVGFHLILAAILLFYLTRKLLSYINRLIDNRFLSYLIVVTASLMIVYVLISTTNLFFKIETGPWQSFFSTGEVIRSFISANWYSYSSVPILFILAIFFLPLFVNWDKERIKELYWAFFFVIAVFTFLYHLLTGSPFGSRVIFFLYPIFIVIMSVSLNLIIKFLENYRNKKVFFTSIVALLIFFFFNPLMGPRMVLGEKDGKIDLKQRSPHQNVDIVAKMLNGYGYQPGDTVITTHNGIFSHYFDNKFVEDEENWPLIRFKYHSREIRYDYPINLYLLKENRLNSGYDDIVNIIKSSDTGWLVLNYGEEEQVDIYNQYIILTDKQLNYLGSSQEHGGFKIYRWH